MTSFNLRKLTNISINLSYERTGKEIKLFNYIKDSRRIGLPSFRTGPRVFEPDTEFPNQTPSFRTRLWVSEPESKFPNRTPRFRTRLPSFRTRIRVSEPESELQKKNPSFQTRIRASDPESDLPNGADYQDLIETNFCMQFHKSTIIKQFYGVPVPYRYNLLPANFKFKHKDS